MKKFYIILSAVLLTLSVQAQSSLGYKLYHKVLIYNMQKANSAKGINAEPVAADTITVIGTLKEGMECPTEELNTLGVKVKNQFLGMVVMEVSMDKLEALGKVSAFKVINANNKHKLKNKQSHIMEHVTDVQDPDKLPEGLEQIYTGQGVIVGVIDQGFDFTHQNFKDADGNSRIKRVWFSTTEDEKTTITEYNTPEAIAALTTDDTTGSHATHTTGTAAGSYSGEYKYQDGTTISGLQGAAYESELLLATGLEDEAIFSAIDNMIKYAKEQNKPLAINMSFGSNDVWMDGLNTATTALKNASDGGNAPGILMCVSAGNEGDSNKTFYKAMKAGDKYATEISFNSEPEGNYDIHVASDDNTPFTVKLIGYDESGTQKTSYTLDQESGTLFSTLSYTRGFAPDHNGRFNIEISSESTSISKEDGVSDYVLEISTDNDCKVRFYAANISCSNTLNGTEKAELTTPDNSNCLNTMIQNKYGFAVGAYASALTVKTWDGSSTSDSEAVGAITPFSSWVSVPCGNADSIGVDFIAPGSLILSSVNHFDTSVSQYLCAKADDNTLMGYMEGTSMSAPNATGVMALWLQACPTLTTTQVREIIKKTADSDNYTTGDNVRRAGFGKINCLAGLQEIIKNYITGISTIDAATTAEEVAKKVFRNGRLIILKNGAKYNAVGQKI